MSVERIPLQRCQSKIPDLEQLVRLRETKEYAPGDFYRPKQLFIDTSDYCPFGCMACGVPSVPRREMAHFIPEEKTVQVIEETRQLDFLCYNWSAGEPLFEENLPTLLRITESFRGRFDRLKINTNAAPFTSEERAKEIYRQLKEAGWAENRYIVPFVAISLGMQQEKIPLDNIVHGLTAFHQVFSPDEARAFISYYHTQTSFLRMDEQLRQRFFEMTGELYPDYLYLIKKDRIREVSRAKSFSPEHFRRVPLEEAVNEKSCFDWRFVNYVNPGLKVTPKGEILSCVNFVEHPGIVIGNIYQDSLWEAIQRANNNLFLRLLAEGGTLAVFKEVRKEVPEISRLLVSDRHLACEALYQVILTHPRLRERFKLAGKK